MESLLLVLFDHSKAPVAEWSRQLEIDRSYPKSMIVLFVSAPKCA